MTGRRAWMCGAAVSALLCVEGLSLAHTSEACLGDCNHDGAVAIEPRRCRHGFRVALGVEHRLGALVRKLNRRDLRVDALRRPHLARRPVQVAVRRQIGEEVVERDSLG